MVDYIVTVYAPSWFEIKKNWQCFNGSQNFHFMVQCVAKIKDQGVNDVAQSALLRNLYFFHPENILLSQFLTQTTNLESS